MTKNIIQKSNNEIGKFPIKIWNVPGGLGQCILVKLYEKTFPGHVKFEDLALFNIKNIVRSRSVPYSILI